MLRSTGQSPRSYIEGTDAEGDCATVQADIAEHGERRSASTSAEGIANSIYAGDYAMLRRPMWREFAHDTGIYLGLQLSDAFWNVLLKCRTEIGGERQRC